MSEPPINQPISQPMAQPAVLTARGISKTFQGGSEAISVLAGVDLDLAAGERVAIVGASGSGKSTLLHILGGLDAADGGTLSVMGADMFRLGQKARGALRNRHLGFIYQFHHLLAEFTALENVAMPLLIRRLERDAALAKAAAMLERLGLARRLGHFPAQLSGGERQRAAVARALVTEPACVLADEPTGNLDRQSAENVFAAMLDASAQLGTAFIIVTHDSALAARADRLLHLSDARLIAPQGVSGARSKG